MAHFELKNKTILIISPEDWGPNFLSKHHYATELSKNNKVYYLNAIARPNQKEVIKTHEISESLTVLSYNKQPRGLLKLPSFLIDLQFKSTVKKIIEIIGNPLDIIWDFDQVRFSNYKQFNAKIKIFHPVDVISNIPSRIKSRKAQNADVTFYLTEEIIKDIISTKPFLFINHGITESYLNNSQTHDSNFIKPNCLNVGYVGNLQSKFIDWKTLRTIVNDNPKINFVFIGPYEKSNLGGKIDNNDILFLKNQPNVTLTGGMKTHELSRILPLFDSFLICYDTILYSREVSNSHKLLEYCSTGKVIISNFISTYKENRKIIEMVENNLDLPKKFITVMSNLEDYNNNDKMNARINFAKQNLYTNHLKKIETFINDING